MVKRTNTRLSIQETHEIPSRGILYDGVPSTLTLRAMDTLDEKRRLSGVGYPAIADLINGCITDNDTVDARQLKLQDLQFLMYKLRIETYGPDYKLNLMCPNPKCYKTGEFTINLDTLPITYLEDDFSEPFLIEKLPKSGDIIEARLMSVSDYISLDNDVKRTLAKNKDYEGDPEIIIKPTYQIVKVNGEEIPSYKRQTYVEKMHAMDRRFFDCKYLEVFNSFGLDTQMVEICPVCGEEILFDLPVTDEFFRPTY